METKESKETKEWNEGGRGERTWRKKYDVQNNLRVRKREKSKIEEQESQSPWSAGSELVNLFRVLFFRKRIRGRERERMIIVRNRVLYPLDTWIGSLSFLSISDDGSWFFLLLLVMILRRDGRRNWGERKEVRGRKWSYRSSDAKEIKKWTGGKNKDG